MVQEKLALHDGMEEGWKRHGSIEDARIIQKLRVKAWGISHGHSHIPSWVELA